jgi:hypothetical protein|nr:hypothetical protein [Kofleriaceae bacterium]
MRSLVSVALVSTGCVAALHVEQAAPVADVAPPFTLTAADGSHVSLADGLARGPVVLVFYRGYW